MTRKQSFPVIALILILLPLIVIGGCGRRAALEPRSGTGLSLKVQVAPRGSTEPVVGIVDTVRVAVRSPDGADVVPPVSVSIASGQRNFQVAVDLAPATDLTVVIMALGRRDIGGRIARGILWYDRVDGVGVAADQTTPITALLQSFVPEPGPVEYPGGTQHRIRWGRVPGAVSYRVDWTEEGGAGSATTTDTVFSADTFPRVYEVAGIEVGGGSGAPGGPVDVGAPPPPSVPTGLSATGASATRIDLTWLPSGGAPPITYDLQRRTPPADFAGAPLATGLETTNFADGTATADASYAYRVRAVGPGGTSDWSAEVSGDVLLDPPGTPGPISATLPATTIVRLAWGAASGRVDAYDVERRTPPAAFTPLLSLSGVQTGMDDSDVLENTTYEYRVAARNRGGRSNFTAAASVQTGVFPPNAPLGLTATAVRAGEIELSWTDNSTNEDGFELQRAPGGGGAFTSLATLIPNATAFTDTKLPDLTPYRYRIRAFRGSVGSEFSTEASATTLGRVPAAPTNLTAVALTPGSVRLAWQDNASNEVSFRIERQANLLWVTQAEPSANVTTLDLTGLAPATTYTFRIFAVNGVGDSDPSNEVEVQTPPDTPDAPSDLLAVETLYNRVRLTWQDNSANEQGFELRRIGGPGAPVTFQLGADDNDYDDTSVASRTAYTYEVRAFSGISFSAFSAPIGVTTPIAPPSALAALVVSSSQIDLSWTAPSGSVGFYDIESRIPPGVFSALATVIGSATAYSARGLESGTTYEFRVRARFNSDISEYSNVASATTVLDPPAAPSGLSGLSTNPTIVTLNWTDNADNETGFEVEERIQGENIFATVETPGVNATSALLDGRTSNTTYEYRVRAVNTAGPSGYSNIIQVTTPNAPPATPDFFRGVGGLDRVDLFWLPGSGGGTVLDYRIERRPAGIGGFTEVGVATGVQLDYGDIGLPTGTTYDYRMRARNTVGFSDYTDTVTVTTILAPPTNLTAVIDPTDTSVILFWSDNTSTESGFEIQRADDATTLVWLPLVTVAENFTFYDDGAVTLGKTYHYRVRATNDGGNSDWSNEVTIVVEEAPLQIPFNLVPHPVGGNGIDFTWVDTNTNETGYELQLGTFPLRGGGFQLLFTQITGPNVTNVPFTGLSSGVTYQAQVRALGSSGAVSPWLGFVCAGTGGTGPAAPSGLTGSYNTIGNFVQLSWTDNSCNEDRFEIYSSGTTSVLIGSTQPNTTAYQIFGLSPGTYFFFVRSVNFEASGSSSTVVVTVGNPSAAPRWTSPRRR